MDTFSPFIRRLVALSCQETRPFLDRVASAGPSRALIMTGHVAWLFTSLATVCSEHTSCTLVFIRQTWNSEPSWPSYTS